MSNGVGLGIGERIRQVLDPLVEPLRIDAFLRLVREERARRAAEDACDTRRMEQVSGREAPAAPRPEPDRPAPAGTEPKGDLAASLEQEVAAFMHREQKSDATDSEVADFMEMMGRGGFEPPAEED